MQQENLEYGIYQRRLSDEYAKIDEELSILTRIYLFLVCFRKNN